MSSFVLLLLLTINASPPENVLEINQPLKGSIEASSPIVSTEVLEERFNPMPVRSKSFSLHIFENDIYSIVLRSHSFDTYLILKDSEGSLICEDDDGWIPSQSQTVVGLKKDQKYTVYACALHGGIGDFEISIRKGKSQDISDEERAIWQDDARLHSTSIRYFARQLLGEGKFQKAQYYFERALKIAETKLGQNSQETAACCYDLARVLSKQSNFDRAQSLLEQAIPVQEELLGARDIQTCDSYEELGAIFALRGQYQNAIDFFEKAFKGLQQNLSAEETRVSHQALYRCASNAFRRGNWDLSERFYRRCLPLAEKFYGKESSTAVNHLTMLGTCLFFMGEWAQAKVFYERALAVQEKEGRTQSLFTIEIRRRLATIIAEEGNFPYAEYLLRKILKEVQFVEPENLNQAYALSALGSVLQFKGEYGEARDVYKQALLLFKNLLGEKSFYVARTNRNLASLELDLLNLDSAHELLLAVQSEAHKLNPKLAIQSCADRGRLFFLEGKYEKAEEFLKKSIALEDEYSFGGKFSNIFTYQELARLYFEWNKFKEAWEYACKAESIAENNLFKVTWSLSEAERYDYLKTQRLTLDLVLDLNQKFKDSISKEFVFNALSAWKANIFQGMLSSKQKIFQTENPEAREALLQLRKIQSQISALADFQDSQEAPFAMQRLEELRKNRSESEKLVERLCAQEASKPFVPWQDLRHALPPQATFINFIEHRSYIPAVRQQGKVIQKAYWGEPQISAWILDKEREEPIDVMLGKSRDIEALLKAFLPEMVRQRPSLQGFKSERLSQLNEKVFKAIWLPLTPYIKGDFIILSGDGCLGSLPFGVIKQPNGRYLIEDYKFTCLQEPGGILKFAQAPQKHEGDLLVVGGVDFEDAASTEKKISEEAVAIEKRLRGRYRNSWSLLPGTLDEARAIFALHQTSSLQKSRLFLNDKEPTEARLKSELSKFSFVHIASHGFFLSEIEQDESTAFLQGPLSGLLSGIVCAGANLPFKENQENGLLTAEEVSWLNLSQCDLVVLSACQTGLGTVYGGEGIIGLRSAFRQAGAKTVISSLWSVGDQSTQNLMQKFYELLWVEGKGKLEALREAQLQLLKKQRDTYSGNSFPYAWGAFVLDGDWR